MFFSLNPRCTRQTEEKNAYVHAYLSEEGTHMKMEDIWLVIVVGFSILWVVLMGSGMLG